MSRLMSELVSTFRQPPTVNRDSAAPDPPPIVDCPLPIADRPLRPLRPYQAQAGRAIVDSALNGRGLTFTVVMARQAGKNELSAQVELSLLLKPARRALDAVKCAPTFDPQCRVSLRRLWDRLVEAGLEPSAQREEGRAVRLGSARQLFLSAEPHSSVVGHTAGILLEV